MIRPTGEPDGDWHSTYAHDSLKVVQGLGCDMGWWPFSRKGADRTNDPQVKGTRSWLQDLRSLCEEYYDNPLQGKEKIIELQTEWKQAHQREELPDELIDGLDKRTMHLISADEKKWLVWLDDENFWKPGWRENQLE